MLSNTVLIDSPSDYRIFQQKDGKADITISGHVELKDGGEYEGYTVRLAVLREYNGTYVRFWESAEMEGTSFSHTFYGIPEGGLYTILSSFSDSLQAYEQGMRGDVAIHIGVGDLYVIAGQSNSAGFAKTPGGLSPELGIHLFRNCCRWDVAFDPMNEPTNTAHPENAEAGVPGQSPYLSFARALKRELGYPIGLIQTSVGGSPLSCWSQRENGILFRNMIRTVGLCGGRVRGILWYQGETDAFEEPLTASYLERFCSFAEDVRKALHDPELPFLTVQLNKLLSCKDPALSRRWAEIREAQRKASQLLPHVYIVPTLDLSLSDAIHNNALSNNAVGERLAYMAFEKIYRLEYTASAPNLLSAEEEDGNRVKLSFGGISLYLVCFELPADRLEFVFEDERGVVEFDDYQCGIDSIVFHLTRAPEGELLASYAPSAFCGSNVPFDRGTGLPILAFYRAVCQKPQPPNV